MKLPYNNIQSKNMNCEISTYIIEVFYNESVTFCNIAE